MGQQKRERKLTGRTYCRPFAEQRDQASPEELAGCRLAQPRRRQGGGERGKLGPKDGIPYHAANRPPVSNQRLPEILDGRHPPGGSWLNTGRTAPERHGRKQAGEKARRTPGECTPQPPGCLSCSGQGKAQNAGAAESALLWNTSGQGTLHREQPGA